MSLDKVSSHALSLIQQLSTHKFGVPRISESSNLTVLEREYLRLYQTRGGDEEQEFALVGNALNKAFYEKNPTVQDSTLVSLITTRDHVSRKIQQLSNSVTSLQQELVGLQNANQSLHDDNAHLVKTITSKVAEAQSQQRKLFSEADLTEYKTALSELKDSKAKTLVLNEFIVALITATGIDWQADPQLADLVLSCGAHDLEKQNDDILNLD
jgi:regulator of replication initiation timing